MERGENFHKLYIYMPSNEHAEKEMFGTLFFI